MHSSAAKGVRANACARASAKPCPYGGSAKATSKAPGSSFPAYWMASALTIGYLATIALHQETSLVDVFRFTATAGVLTHVAAGAPHIIWFRRKFLLDALDGLAYALATGAAFAWLWPN